MPRLTVKEVKRRVPTLRLIRDSDVRRETVRLTREAPEYFWRVPASTNGYHHPLCRRTHGLWLHTLMLSTPIERLADSYIAQGRLSKKDIDLAHAAAILHDQRKNGPTHDVSDSSVSDHDVQMAEVIRDSPVDDRVASAVAAHMGPWYDGPEPASDFDDLLHTADMICSTRTVDVAVQGPLPEEFKHDGVKEADLRG